MARLRFFALLLATVIATYFAFKGSPVVEDKFVSPAETASPSSGPTILFEAQEAGVEAGLNSANISLSPSSTLSISGYTNVPRGKPTKVYIEIGGILIDGQNSQGWTGEDGMPWLGSTPPLSNIVEGITIDAPPGIKLFKWDLTLSACTCTHSSPPYLTINALTQGYPPIGTAVGPVEIAIPGITTASSGKKFGWNSEMDSGASLPGRSDGKFYPVRPSNILKDTFDVGSPDKDYTIIGAEPGNVVKDSAWTWSNVASGRATLLDVHAKDSQDDQLFRSGIFLGIAGAALIGVVDSFFDLQMVRRKERWELSAKQRTTDASD